MDTQKKPLISVIMSVYNEEKYILESVSSILNQTLQDFEIIIFDDCSTDNTVNLIESLEDSRIKIIKNTENRGLTKNLNSALDIARGDYIARMDGDDISLPERFEKQVKYLNSHPDTWLVSCQTETFGAENLRWKLNKSPEELKCMMLVRPVLAHPGYMFRRELIAEGLIYDETFVSAQDYNLASRVAQVHDIGVVAPILLRYRAHNNQVSSKSGGKQLINADRVRKSLLEQLGVELTDKEYDYYRLFAIEKKINDEKTFLSVFDIICRICEADRTSKLYNGEILENTMRKLYTQWIVRNRSASLLVKVLLKRIVKFSDLFAYVVCR